MTGNGCDRSRRCGDRPIALGNDEAKVLERRKTKRHGELDDENILHAPDVDLLLREAQEDEKLDRLFAANVAFTTAVSVEPVRSNGTK